MADLVVTSAEWKVWADQERSPSSGSWGVILAQAAPEALRIELAGPHCAHLFRTAQQSAWMLVLRVGACLKRGAPDCVPGTPVLFAPLTPYSYSYFYSRPPAGDAPEEGVKVRGKSRSRRKRHGRSAHSPLERPPPLPRRHNRTLRNRRPGRWRNGRCLGRNCLGCHWRQHPAGNQMLRCPVHADLPAAHLTEENSERACVQTRLHVHLRTSYSLLLLVLLLPPTWHRCSGRGSKSKG